MTASRDLTIKVMMTAVETIFRVWVQRDGMVCNMQLSMPSLTHDSFKRSDHKASRDLTIKVMMTAVETIFRVWVQRDGMVCNMTLSMPSLTHDNFERSDHKGNDDSC
ncbi:hypothetical protein J6590_055520 [Homalodisca vitripennis]|nr:hypothetical protein J6590_055520 [Homalodisca vitripennis]